MKIKFSKILVEFLAKNDKLIIVVSWLNAVRFWTKKSLDLSPILSKSFDIFPKIIAQDNIY